jgi:hypothetical protein
LANAAGVVSSMRCSAGNSVNHAAYEALIQSHRDTAGDAGQPSS